MFLIAVNPSYWYLGLALFNILISNLDNGAECMLNKFCRWHKTGGVADTPECCVATQRVFDGLEKQADRNLMKFKRKSTKSGTWGATALCTLLGTTKAAWQKRTCGSCWTQGGHHALATKKANSILGCIRQSIANRLGDNILIRTLWSVKGYTYV